MGKKDAQRTKGNTKTSSSTRSAEFLGNNLGFIGFGTIAETAFVPVHVDVQDPPDDIPPDMRVVLRKLHKKDSTTKIKALNEFQDLAEKLGEAEMLAVLTYWPSVFNKLATDIEGRIRELSFIVHKIVVTRVGRNLATCLKKVCGVWYLGQFDPHNSAASAATAAWSAAFPGNKLATAITFCHSEIIKLVTDNLLIATPHTLSDPNLSSPEEMQSNYVRIISMSFAALLQLVKLSSTECFSTLLDNPKFLKFSKDGTPAVRKGLFEFLHELVSVHPQFASNYSKQMAKTVFNNLNDNHAGSACATWSLALLLLSSFPDDSANAIKNILPSIYKLLSSGGNGVAKFTFHNLMPFLSKLQQTKLKSDISTEKWLSSLNSGLETLLENSKVEDEIQEVSTAYVECTVTILAREDLEHSEKVKILEKHLLNNIVIKSLTEKRLKGEGKLYETVLMFVGSWITKENYSELFSVFWKTLSEELLKEFYIDQSIVFLSYFSHLDSDIVTSIQAKLLDLIQSKLSSVVILDKKVYLTHLNNLITKCHVLDKPGLRFDIEDIVPMLEDDELSSCALSTYVTIVSSSGDSEKAVEKLVDVCIKSSNFEKTFTHLLEECRDKDAKTQELLKKWLNHEKIREFLINFVSDQKLHTKTSTVNAQEILKNIEDLSFDEKQKILSSFNNGLQLEPSRHYVQTVAQLSMFLFSESEMDVWESGQGFNVVKLLFSRTDLDSNLDQAWLTPVLKSGSDSKLRQSIRSLVLESIRKKRSYEDYATFERKTMKLLHSKSIQEVVEYLNPVSIDTELENGVIIEDCIDGSIFSLDIDVTSNKQIDKELAEEIVKKDLLICKVFEDSFTSSQNENSLEEFVQVVLSFQFLRKIVTSSHEFLIELESRLTSVTSKLDSNGVKSILQMFKKRSFQHGKLSSVSLVWFLDQIMNLIADQKIEGVHDQIVDLVPVFSTIAKDLTPDEATTAAQILKYVIQNPQYQSLTKEMKKYNQSMMHTLIQILSNVSGFVSETSIQMLWLLRCCLNNIDKEEFEDEKTGLCEKIEMLMQLFHLTLAEEEQSLLYNQNIAEITWCQAVRVSNIVQLFASVISKCPKVLSAEQWDFVCCSLVSWCTTIEESTENLSLPTVALVTSSVCHLVNSVESLFNEPNYSHSEKLKQEWTDFFSDGVYSILVPVYVSVCKETDYTRSQTMIQNLSSAVSLCPEKLLLEANLPPLHFVQDIDLTTNLPENFIFLFNHLAPLLTSENKSIKMSSYELLTKVAKNCKFEDPDSESETLQIPQRLIEVIKKGDTLLDSLLHEFKIGEVAGPIPAGTVAHDITTGYLLAWKIVLVFLNAAGDELGPKYTEYLKSEKYFDKFLRHLFILIPPGEAKECKMLDFDMSIRSPATEKDIYHLACKCWMSVCQYLPAVARQWWQYLDNTSKEAVEKLTSSVVTPALWVEEIKAINSAEKSDNMSVRVRESVREVVTTYTIDEGSLELVVVLPANYPLTAVSVDTGKKVGVETALWRKWVLHLTTFLTYQNGSILGGLNLWKQNVDKRFEGVEECYICFYILHGSNHQLPKLQCRTCKKKFHSACLYKWFSTSNNSSCPLCRNLF